MAVASAAASTAARAQAPATPSLSVGLNATHVVYGSRVALRGRVSEAGRPVADAVIEAQASAYPFGAFVVAAYTRSDDRGGYAFTRLKPGRDTRYRVVLRDQPGVVSQPVAVAVRPDVRVAAHYHGRGRTRLAIELRHTRSLASPPVDVFWFVSPRGRHHFSLAAQTVTRELRRGDSYASVVIDPPSHRFDYQARLMPAWGAAMGGSSELDRGGRARGVPLAPFPTAAGIASAEAFLSGRVGASSVAVMDDYGRLDGLRVREQFHTASVVKAMLLVAYLQRLAAEGRDLDAASQAVLYPMIHSSDNGAADSVYATVGNDGLLSVARQAGMSDFAPSSVWWALSETSAADQARFFYVQDELIPLRFLAYARWLLSGIEPDQSWGVPAVARPRFGVYFKGGWLPQSEGLVDQAARLERDGTRFSVAVMTTGDPSMDYGEQTIAGVAARLLG